MCKAEIPAQITQQYKQDKLEQAMDNFLDLTEFVQFLVEILHEKAEHILTNWQDKVLASYYTRLAVKITDWL
jgi:hypothetical protein